MTNYAKIDAKDYERAKDVVVEAGGSVEDFETDDVIALGDEPERVERFLEIAKKKGLDVELVG